MFSEMNSLVSLFHLNVLFLLGLALFGGTIGGRLFQKIHIPQVVGYIIIGILLGSSGLGVVNAEIIESLSPFNYFALGLIGFMVGGALKKEVFDKYGKQFLYILLSEGITPFILVSVFVGIIGTLCFGPHPWIWALSLLLGSIASATDPATTSAVLKEYKTRGPLTINVLGIVALDDGLALLLFTIASSVAGILIGDKENTTLWGNIIQPFYEIGGAIIIGVLFALILRKMLSKYSEKERILAFTIGTVLIVVGISLALKISMILAVMSLGVVVVNLVPKKSKQIFELVDGFTPPIYVLFFVLVGGKLEVRHMTMPILFLVLGYLFFGLSGKMLGCYIGALLSRSTKTVVKYMPFALFSQAGIAIGLSLLASHHFPGQLGTTLVVITTATTFVTQIMGPPFTKFAVTKAKEIGLDITEEDIIMRSDAHDVMDKNPPIIYENMKLADILRIFSENDNLYYPMVSRAGELKGIISVEGIRHTFLETDIGDIVLADDLKEPVLAKISADMPLADITELLNKHDLEYLPVVDSDNKVQGFIERRKINRFISTKIIELQKHTEALG